MMYDNPLYQQLQVNFESALSGGYFNWEVASESFFIGKSTVYLTNMGGREIMINRRDQIDGRVLWSVNMQGWALGKDNEYHYEPMPSSRTEEYLKLTRFGSKESALDALIAHEKKYAGKTPPQLYL